MLRHILLIVIYFMQWFMYLRASKTSLFLKVKSNHGVLPKLRFKSTPLTSNNFLSKHWISLLGTLESLQKWGWLNGVTSSGKMWHNALWFNTMHSGKKWWIREFVPSSTWYILLKLLLTCHTHSAAKMQLIYTRDKQTEMHLISKYILWEG